LQPRRATPGTGRPICWRSTRARGSARDAGSRTISIVASAVERQGRPLVRITVEGCRAGHRARRDVAPVRGLRHHQGARQGYRMGLRICRRIVEEMDGDISARNRAEGGACFGILLSAATTADFTSQLEFNGTVA
jgi:histidine kinase/DNA gyrase B/HSP90-like ATPase